MLLVILWLLQTVFLTDIYKYFRQQELKKVIATVEKEIENPDLHMILFLIQTENDIMITPTHEFVLPPRPDLRAQGRRGAPAVLDTITETKEFTLRNGQTLSLTFYALIAPVNSTVTTLRMQLYFITAIMILFSILLAVIIAKKISDPIEEISRSAQLLAKGNYNTHFAGQGFQEIVALSETLNTAAKELGKTENLRRELLANVSHDLRTPLSLIYSYAEMMHDFPEEITPEQTQVIMDETRRLTALVNDVLDMSKLESEMEQLNISTFNLTEIILTTTKLVEKLLENEGFKIIFKNSNINSGMNNGVNDGVNNEINNGDVYVDADEIKISRAFYNLLINAVNYSGDNRIITVAQSTTETTVKISVTDSGEGISEDELPFIWDRYYKSAKRHKRPVTGTGLGLPIVKKVIELHGGKYGVVSEAGRGSTFWFEIEVDTLREP